MEPSSGPSGSASRQVSSVADVGVFHSWNCPPQRPCSSHRPVWSRPSSPAAFPNPLGCRPLTVTRLSPRFRCRVGGGAPRGRWPPSAAQTVRAVFPHTAFTKTSSRDEDRWRNQRVEPSSGPSGSASRQVSSVADVGVFHSWNCPPQRPCSSHRPVWSRPSSPAAFPNPLGCRPLTVTRLSPRFRCRVGGGAPRGRWPPSAAQTVRAVFPHTAFTKTSSRDEDRWRNQRVEPSSGPSGSASRQVSSVADVGVFHSWNCPPQRPCSSHRPVWSRPSSPAAFPNPLGCRPLTVTRLSPRFRCRVGGGAPRGRWPPSAAQTVRAVFPHTAFTKTSSRDEDRWRNQRVEPSSGPSGSASRQVSSVADVGVFHSWNCPPQRPCSSHRPVWSRPSSPAAFPNPLGCRPLTVTRLSPRFRYYSAVRLLDEHPFPLRSRL